MFGTLLTARSLLSNRIRPNTAVIYLLKMATFLVFIGRAYQHLCWDAPYREFFWDHASNEFFIKLIFNISWFEYVTSPLFDSYIQWAIKGMGGIYLLLAVMTLFINKNHRVLCRLLKVGSFFLFILAYLYFKAKAFQLAQLIEYSSQVAAPFLLALCLKDDENDSQKIFNILRISIAFTFLGHGLYAVGFYPVPGPFIDMIIKIIGGNEANAIFLLKMAGTFDIIIFFILMNPKFHRFYPVFLTVACIWGLVTAFARVVAHFKVEFWSPTLHQWAFETLVRLPHGLLPLSLLCWVVAEKMAILRGDLDSSKVWINSAVRPLSSK